MTPDDQPDPDHERVQRRSRDRQHERTETVEHMSAKLDDVLEESEYPVSSEDLAVEYADEMIDLPNETESLGSVFDRLVDEEYESVDEAREAVLNQLTGREAGMEEYNDERALNELEDESQESNPLE